ncbi:MAG: acyl-CoA dehydrogenase family protein [Acidimicrobiia bacterium]
MAAVEVEVEDSDEAGAVRDEARSWFEANWDAALSLGEWWSLLAESGWGLPTWPRDWFGRGLPSHLGRVVAEEARAVGSAPAPTGVSIMLACPTIIAHGTDEQKRRFVPPAVLGEQMWCQLFSEPGAGSDLAGIQTRAVRDGDEWVVDGQKVWTSGAQFSDWGILIARTNPDVAKHKGITFFVIDMDQPGVEVRPIVEMSGGKTFNEVFFSGARVPHDNVIGAVDGGWGVTMTTLANERQSLGAQSSNFMGGGRLFEKADLGSPAGERAKPEAGEFGGLGTLLGGGAGPVLSMVAQVSGKGGDAITRQNLALLYSLVEISRYTGLRVSAATSRGLAPGPEVSTGKLAASHLVRQARDTLMPLFDGAAMLNGADAPFGGMAQLLTLMSPAVSIAGGTDQIQRNIIGERVLGLPAEPRVDKDVPFKDTLVN